MEQNGPWLFWPRGKVAPLYVGYTDYTPSQPPPQTPTTTGDTGACYALGHLTKKAF